MTTPTQPPADFPQVNHPWAGSEDGHDCATCIALEPADAPLANLYKCDRMAHVIGDVNQAMADHHKRVATENLRRYGGVAGPGLRQPLGAAVASEGLRAALLALLAFAETVANTSNDPHLVHEAEALIGKEKTHGTT